MTRRPTVQLGQLRIAQLQNQTSELVGLHDTIIAAKAQADRLKMPFVVYLLDLAIAALKQDRTVR
ncbi:MAG: hypothetical protein HKN05_11030 [Rhizobiales bacterium]|nr:hypothetical protein [Hyphomicrobiales bacterium]